MNANWHDSAFFGIHYDFHARPADLDIGATLTPEHLRETLLRIKPDWIHCDCKGHPGYASWPTTTGTPAPGLVKDVLRIHRDVTAELGIKLGMHYSGVWDARAIELHPEWAARDVEGVPSVRMTCRNSEYLDALMIPQLLELVDKCDVDGFWVDGDNWASLPCWCSRCTGRFTRETGIAEIPKSAADPHWFAWLAFHRGMFVDYVARWTSAVKKRKPDCCVTSSYMYGARQPDPEMAVPLDYLSGDLDFRWGAEHAVLESRVYDARRSLTGVPWDLMAWMHTKPGEMTDPRPWQLKPLPHLCQEVASVVAHGGGVMVYENPQRAGHLTAWHHEVIRGLSDFCRARQGASFHSTTAAETAILHYADHFYRHNNVLYQYEPACDPIEAALHLLLETGHTADILTEDVIAARLGQYKLAVVPETTGLTAGQLAALEAYVRQGGHLVVAGAHFAREHGAFVGASPAGGVVGKGSHVAVGEVSVALFGEWQGVAPAEGTEVLARRLADQDVAFNVPQEAVITRRTVGKGTITAFHGAVFSNYYHWPHPHLRGLFAQQVGSLDIPWTVRVASPTPRLEVVARRQGGTLTVHLINRGPYTMLPPKRIFMEEFAPVEDITLQVRVAEQPRRVQLTPARTPIEHSYANGVLTVRIAAVAIHEIVQIE